MKNAPGGITMIVHWCHQRSRAGNAKPSTVPKPMISRTIAMAICRARSQGVIETTGRLAEIVERAVGGRRGSGHHPATRTFQALRMCVNGELESLEAAIAGAFNLLGEGGRLVVITFESLTDRIVKRSFTAHVGRNASLHEGGSRWEGSLPRMEWVARKPITPSEEEISDNPRARSAKLRAVRRFNVLDGTKEESQ